MRSSKRSRVKPLEWEELALDDKKGSKGLGARQHCRRSGSDSRVGLGSQDLKLPSRHSSNSGFEDRSANT